MAFLVTVFFKQFDYFERAISWFFFNRKVTVGQKNRIIISVDVGGTFCDCYMGQNGVARSLKLFSTGTLRALIHSISGSTHAILDQNWGLPFPKVLSGCYCENIRTGQVSMIRSFDALTGLVIFEKKLPLEKGDMVELTMRAEAPVFAAHLITGIPLDEPLRDIELRIGTTKALMPFSKKGNPVSDHQPGI
jgi:hypothetical protein